MGSWKVMLACGSASALAVCNSYPTPPLVFYQAATLGISASATGAGATPEFSLGYRDTDVAVVPVADSLALPIHDDLRFRAFAAFGTSGRTGSFGFFTA